MPLGSPLVHHCCRTDCSTLKKNDKKLNGFTINLRNKSKTVKIAQYADDFILFLGDIYQINYALSIINEFGKVCWFSLKY